jgi:hypothetical protein
MAIDTPQFAAGWFTFKSACAESSELRTYMQLLRSKCLTPRLAPELGTMLEVKDLTRHDCATQGSCAFRREIIHTTRKPFEETNHEKPV